jgi:hypothetical protein
MKRAAFCFFLLACSRKEETPPTPSASPVTIAIDAGAEDGAARWVTYKAAKASVDFPGSFNVIFSSPDATTFKIAGARGGTVSLRASADEALGPEIANAQRALDDHARTAASEDQGYTRVSIKAITLGAHSGREEVSKKDGNLVRVRVYLVGRRFYTLTADRKESDLDAEKTVSRFLESLALVE